MSEHKHHKPRDDKEAVTVTVDGKPVTRYVTNWTTIRIRKPTRNRLEELGDLDESYDSVISKLLDKHDISNNKAKK